ncbi:hypothetical protein VUR80DRAFT_4093 [Thermomyces stellatus]
MNGEWKYGYDVCSLGLFLTLEILLELDLVNATRRISSPKRKQRSRLAPRFWALLHWTRVFMGDPKQAHGVDPTLRTTKLSGAPLAKGRNPLKWSSQQAQIFTKWNPLTRAKTQAAGTRSKSRIRACCIPAELSPLAGLQHLISHVWILAALVAHSVRWQEAAYSLGKAFCVRAEVARVMRSREEAEDQIFSVNGSSLFPGPQPYLLPG